MKNSRFGKIIRCALSLLLAAGLAAASLCSTGCNPEEGNRSYSRKYTRSRSIRYRCDTDTSDDYTMESDDYSNTDNYNDSNAGVIDESPAPAVERGYFGAQLDSDLAAEIYDRLVNRYAIEQYSADTYTFKMSEPVNFMVPLPDDTVKGEELDVIKASTPYQLNTSQVEEAVQKAFIAFRCDHPEVYWIYWYSYYYSSNWTVDKYNDCDMTIDSITFTMIGTYYGDYDERDAVSQSIDKAVSTVRKKAKSGSRYDLLKQVHNYIAKKTTYDYPAAELKGDAYKYAHCCAPAFNGTGHFVCEGYSKAFKVICDRLGIPCILVRGDAELDDPDPNADKGHMWNYVQMEDGNWYGVDVTWDDADDSEIHYEYFLAGAVTNGYQKTFSEEHVPKGAGEIQSSYGSYQFGRYPSLSLYGYSDLY